MYLSFALRYLVGLRCLRASKMKLHGLRYGYRSSHQMCSLKKVVLKNFAKFTGKHLCQSLFFNKVAGLRPATLFKKRLWHKCFPVNFAKFHRTPFYIEHLWWLLLKPDTLNKGTNKPQS